MPGPDLSTGSTRPDGWVRLAASPGDLPGLTDAGLAPAPGQIKSGDEALTAGISALLADLPTAEVIARAHAAGVPTVRARQPQELIADAQLIRHGLLSVLDRDDRGVRRVDPGRWLEMPDLPARGPGKAPGAGEHTEILRREANLSS
jgi:crotonobetainyl-CoA:carnitine CoA-transferase CaiB-like acyl-CoA transferase